MKTQRMGHGLMIGMVRRLAKKSPPTEQVKFAPQPLRPSGRQKKRADEEVIAAMRYDHEQLGMQPGELSKKYGFSWGHTRNVLNYTAWPHVRAAQRPVANLLNCWGHAEAAQARNSSVENVLPTLPLSSIGG